MRFTYSSGQKPLDGYTIKRGIGKGGFGEVYFALSDGGKEVALKVVRHNQDVELRGMGQCLNLKHPNLVHLFDIREDNQGNSWVVMEYVAGESLSTILARHPSGLAPELARQWFVGLADAVSCLHDHGIVHRDLKPGNVFIENGLVKVGDYGLCKCISGSQGRQQTQSIGTVHYMAPEISHGNYNKQIDVYSAGIVLYEMLTGHVPFDGESAAEVLMKHLTAPPDLSKLPRDYVPILSRALAKNPAQRYHSIQEMARAVMSVGTVSVAQPLPVPPPQKPLYVPKLINAATVPIPTVAPVVIPPRTRLAELCGSLALSALLSGIFSILWAAALQTNNLLTIGRFFFLGLACCWAVLIPAKIWTKRSNESLPRRLGLLGVGLVIGFLALWLEGYDMTSLLTSQAQAQEAKAVPLSSAPLAPDVRVRSSLESVFRTKSQLPVVACYLSYFGLAFFAMRWWQLADRRRPQRFSLFSVLVAGGLGFILMFLCPGPQEALGIVALVSAAAIVQLVSPWEKTVFSRPRKLRLPNT